MSERSLISGSRRQAFVLEQCWHARHAGARIDKGPERASQCCGQLHLTGGCRGCAYSLWRHISRLGPYHWFVIRLYCDASSEFVGAIEAVKGLDGETAPVRTRWFLGYRLLW